jgi:adenylate kinase family enzyme
MQLELIGCTGAGKSTLTRRILQAGHEQGVDLVLGDDFVLEQVRLHRIKSRLLRTLLVDLLALFACLGTWRNHLEFYLFATRLLFQLPTARLEKLNLLRNVLKKIGIYEIIRFRSTDQQIILVDEGVLQAAHNLFVHGLVRVKAEHLDTFARSIPFPDVVVYLRQPESSLIHRTMKRGHKRIPDRSYINVARFIEQAVATFDKLIQNLTVESKLLAVDGTQQVTISHSDRDNQAIGLVLQIIQNGINIGIYESLQVGRRPILSQDVNIFINTSVQERKKET